MLLIAFEVYRTENKMLLYKKTGKADENCINY